MIFDVRTVCLGVITECLVVFVASLEVTTGCIAVFGDFLEVIVLECLL